MTNGVASRNQYCTGQTLDDERTAAECSLRAASCELHRLGLPVAEAQPLVFLGLRPPAPGVSCGTDELTNFSID